MSGGVLSKFAANGMASSEKTPTIKSKNNQTKVETDE